MGKQKNIPVLRFPEFEGEWLEKSLNEFSRVYDGTHQTPDYVENGIPFYSVEQVTANDFNKTKFISESVYEKEKERVIIERGDILLTRIGNIGTPKYIDWDVKASFYVSLALIKKSNKYNSKFFGHYIKTRNFQKELWNRTIHVAFPIKINLGEISNCRAKLPNNAEQQKIATFFTAIDQKISQLKKKHQLLEQYKKGVMQKIFSQQIRFKDDDGREFPKWEKKRLGDIVQFRNGKAHEQNITEEGEYIVVNSKFISTEGKVRKLTDFQICPLQINEIVMVMSDIPNGKALAKCYLIEQNKKYSLNQRICALKATRVVPHLLFYVLNRNKYYLKFDSGVGQTNLAKDEVLSCPLTLPQSMKEQTKIANFLSAIDDKITHTQKQIEHAEVWKKGLMQQMFV